MDLNIIEGLRRLGASQEGRNYVAKFDTWDAFWLGNDNVSYHAWLVGRCKVTTAKEIAETCIALAERVSVYVPTDKRFNLAEAFTNARTIVQDWGRSAGKVTGYSQKLEGLATLLNNEQASSAGAHRYALEATRMMCRHFVQHVSNSNAQINGLAGHLYAIHGSATQAAHAARTVGNDQGITDHVLRGDLRRFIDRLAIERHILAQVVAPAPTVASSGGCR